MLVEKLETLSGFQPETLLWIMVLSGVLAVGFAFSFSHKLKHEHFVFIVCMGFIPIFGMVSIGIIRMLGLL